MSSAFNVCEVDARTTLPKCFMQTKNDLLEPIPCCFLCKLPTGYDETQSQTEDLIVTFEKVDIFCGNITPASCAEVSASKYCVS